MLTLIKRFAQHHGCHVWFVAHPRQVGNTSLVYPLLYYFKNCYLDVLASRLIAAQLDWESS